MDKWQYCEQRGEIYNQTIKKNLNILESYGLSDDKKNSDE